jgi:hypothetical protein
MLAWKAAQAERCVEDDTGSGQAGLMPTRHLCPSAQASAAEAEGAALQVPAIVATTTTATPTRRRRASLRRQENMENVQ